MPSEHYHHARASGRRGGRGSPHEFTRHDAIEYLEHLVERTVTRDSAEAAHMVETALAHELWPKLPFHLSVGFRSVHMRDIGLGHCRLTYEFTVDGGAYMMEGPTLYSERHTHRTVADVDSGYASRQISADATMRMEMMLQRPVMWDMPAPIPSHWHTRPLKEESSLTAPRKTLRKRIVKAIRDEE